MPDEQTQEQEVERRIEKGKAYLPCILTQKEIYDAGKSLTDALKRRAECENRLDSVKQQIKGEMTSAEGDIAKYQQLVSSEKEHRMVDVEVRFDFKAGTKETVRMDTGELIKTERISEEERQKVMVFMSTPVTPAPAAAPSDHAGS